MNNNIYYLPIKSANLAHYYAKGCVCPTNYFNNRNEDIQNIFSNSLLLSTSKFTQDTNCSLEIVLNEKEERAKKITNNFFLFECPLPISRVKRIIFKEEKQKVNTEFNVNSGAAFLPKQLIEVDSNSKEINSSELNMTQHKESDKNWSSQIDFYNRILGGFAVMSIAGNKFQNYPLNYFNTLANINSLIKDEITNQNVAVNNNYDWTLINNEKFKGLHKAIYSTINYNVVEKFAENDKISLPKENGIYVLDKIDQSKATYLIAVLSSYGQGARMKIDTFIFDLISDQFPKKKKEGLALIFGINKGYESFRNKYKTNSYQIDVKFKLDSQLDFYTIESIYQFVFNKKKDNFTFKYLDDWCPKHIDENKRNEFETYQVLDKTILYKKKEERVSSENSYQNFSPNSIIQKIVLEINKWIPTYLKNKKNDDDGLKYFEKLLESDFDKYTKDITEKITNENKKANLKKLDFLNIDNSKLRKIVLNKEEEILNLKKQIEDLKVNKKNQFDKQILTNVSNSKTSTKQHLKNNDLFSNTNLLSKSIRKEELLEMGITKLRKTAKEYNVSKINKYENTVADKEKLVEEIIKKINK